MSETPFDVLTTELKDTKLIEASAGTGKTYSIAILALRLILEKGIPIEKILMVTFTKAAVAELESRIREFVRTGHKYLKGKVKLSEKDTIRGVIDGGNKSEVEKLILLENAIRNFDKLSVMTIHGFCQKTIDEFTFETGQSFDYEILTDDTELLESVSNRYVRESLNTIDPKVFESLRDDLDLSKLHQLLNKYLSGMKFIDYDKDEGTLEELKKQIATSKEKLDDFIKSQFPLVVNIPKSNALIKDAIAGDVEEFKRRFRNQIKKPAGYFSAFDFMREKFEELDEEIRTAENEYFAFFYADFFKKAAEEIKKIKHKKGYISYNDQINTVHAVRNDEIFRTQLARKYQAVFIDEFQDTDTQQYEIFDSLFSGSDKTGDEEPIVFYIGDPKQSIYGWRGADLENYKVAKKKVEEENNGVETMNTNYRSTSEMIEALNVFLKPDDNYNLFLDGEIHYKKVDTGAANLGRMTDKGEGVSPITLWQFDDNDDDGNFKAVALEIARILKEEVKIKENRVKPGDIGVLVRSNQEGDDIKNILSDLNIPAVKRDDKKILESEEARMIKYLLKAVLSPTRGNINRSLLSQWFGYTVQSITESQDEEKIETFIRLQKIVREEGIYNMISSFITIYNVRSICMKKMLGQRVLTNINQIAEILHTKEKQLKYTPEELLLWMNRSADISNEGYEQRIESDEDAVNISTIHIAKGLQYKIVFAPSLCMTPKLKLREKNKVNDFKKEGDYYFTFNYPALNEEDKKLHDDQEEQENRRLIYVTLTRPVYKCYVSYVPRKSYGKTVETSMDEIVSYQPFWDSKLIEVVDLTQEKMEMPTEADLPVFENETLFSPRSAPKIKIENTFGIHSFSALSRTHLSAPFEKIEFGDPNSYDQFIFQKLPRGANVGTALHSIFEQLEFNEPISWSQTVENASKYYPNLIRDESLNQFRKLVNHVMYAQIQVEGEAFQLNAIQNHQKLPEMEFLFSMDKVNPKVITELLGDDAQLNREVEMEGLMTGFIDLVFEHNGKYYILDWKSNHLGNSTEHYNEVGMKESMTGNNYHLQYMIYTVALKRWLENRIENFDFDAHFGGVIYLFLRGVREDSSTGIFTKRPTRTDIEKLDNALKNKI